MPYGIRFNLGGAPATPHNVIDPTPGSRSRLIGQIVPGEIVPLEDRGIPLEDARKWADDPGCPLELVQIDRNGDEVTSQPKLTKADLIAHAASLDPPLELHESQTKEEMHAAIAEHDAATVTSDDQAEGDTGTDTTEGS